MRSPADLLLAGLVASSSALAHGLWTDCLLYTSRCV